MARTDPQTNIRLPFELKNRLGAAARANTRTMNAEILNRLEVSFSSVEPTALAGDEKLDIPDMLASIFGSLIGLQGQIKDLEGQCAEIKALITAAGARVIRNNRQRISNESGTGRRAAQVDRSYPR